MNVIEFPRPQGLPQGWQSNELAKLTSACAGSVSAGDVSGWEIGSTEYGDPQLYMLGPAPDHECVLSISRLGRLYVLEDGKGQVLLENDNLMLLAEETCSVLRRKKAAITAQLAVCWCAVREFFEEKVEPVLAEPMEVITHFAPHFAALA
jgi:hypothetical protein